MRKIRLNGFSYVEAIEKNKMLDPEDLIKVMNESPVSIQYIKGVMRKLVPSFQKYGAELVTSDGDIYISIILEDREILVAPIVKDRISKLLVEVLGFNWSLKLIGTVDIDQNSTYKGIDTEVKKLVQRATTRPL